jgi:hypothetical protein
LVHRQTERGEGNNQTDRRRHRIQVSDLFTGPSVDHGDLNLTIDRSPEDRQIVR